MQRGFLTAKVTVTPLKDVDCVIVDGVTIWGRLWSDSEWRMRLRFDCGYDYGQIRSEVCACASTATTSRCDTIDGVTIVGGYGSIQSGGCVCASTVAPSRCVGGCDRPVESSIVDTSWRVDGCGSPVSSAPVSSGWRFSVGGGMRLIRETCATVSVDLSTRRNR